MTDRFEELTRRKKELLHELRRREGFPRQRKRFDREEDERRFQDFVDDECEKRYHACKGIERECDFLYERKVKQLKRERDELLERERQKIDVRYEELFDREYQKIERERQIDQRAQQQTFLSRDEQPQNLTEYLAACHALHLKFQKGACRSLITQKEALSWTFPRRIIPWDGFRKLQEGIWHRLVPDSYFTSQCMFSPPQRLESVRRTLTPVTSEASLQHFGRYTIESAVMEMMDRLFEDDVIWNGLGFSDDVRVTMEADKDLGQVYEPMLESSWHKDAGELKLSMRNSHRKAKRAGIWANRSCIYRQLNGQKKPVFAIVHQLPHRLQLDEIDCGLASEIKLEQDVINKEGSDFTFASRTLVAATITQLFSYMVSKDIRYGCVSTGEAFIFCCISKNDPSNVYCAACVPERDVLPDDPLGLHRTAAASVFGLVLQALREKPLPESWYDSVTNLDTWTMGYDDMLDRIRKMDVTKPQSSPLRVPRWRGFDQSPLLAQQLRSRREVKGGQVKGGDKIRLWLDNVAGQENVDEDASESAASEEPTIRDQPFCSHKCLSGLVHGRSMDESCPNIDYHGFGHPDFDSFLSNLRTQLAEEGYSEANFVPLGVTNPHRCLFKVRLASCGYTFIAKGGKGSAHIWDEKLIYDEMDKFQGRHVPVCLGVVELAVPRYYNRPIKEFLLLSWAGRPFQNCLKQVSRDQVSGMVEEILKTLHKQGIIYNGGMDPDHFLYDASRSSVMIVDFGESSTRFCEIPDIGNRYSTARKRKRGWPEDAKLMFEEDTVCAQHVILHSTVEDYERRFSDSESEVGDDSVSHR
ncbi:hypothetical protein ACHAQJ_004182 [Trichoderma viride]